jgi:DNA-binding MarR family transcriptional regulator
MEHRALGFFARTPDTTLSEMVEHSGKDKAQLARIVRDLREKALLEATPDSHDRRITRLNLSEAGRAAHDATQANHRAIAGLSPAECEQLASLMAKILANLEE